MIRREFLAGLTSLSALAAAPAVSFAQAPMNLGQQWDVIVIGSGLAGLSAALSASEKIRDTHGGGFRLRHVRRGCAPG